MTIVKLRIVIYSVLVLLCSTAIYPHEIFAFNPSVLGVLPSQVNESSGVDWTGTTGFWTHNDGWGDNTIYLVNNTGGLERSVTINGAINGDWEDITHDANRNYMFIGDFGNNANNRTDLHIDRIPYPSNFSCDTVTAEKINYIYPDQHQFPAAWTNFDMEGFFHYAGHLFLFTKPCGNAVGYTKMYMLPDVPGNYIAILVDSFPIPERINSAAISPDGSTVILFNEGRMHMFRNFIGTDFFHGQHTAIVLDPPYTQKEAVTFSSNSTIVMSDEDAGAGSFLYSLDLSSIIPPSTTGMSKPESRTNFSSYPNPCGNYFVVVPANQIESAMMIKLYNLTGKLVRESSREYPVASIRMETAELPSGVYFYKIFVEGREVQTSRIIITY